MEKGPQGTHHHIEKTCASGKGAPGKVCKGHCAIGLLGAAVLNEEPFSPTGTNNNEAPGPLIGVLGLDLAWNPII